MVLSGKVAIVTGATSGIGRAVAERFAAEGARVVLAGRREEVGLAVAGAIGERARFVRADVAREDDVAGLVAGTLAAFGRIDILVNNAGDPNPSPGVADVRLDGFNSAMAVHVGGALLTAKHAAPVMKVQGGGAIVNMASISGLQAGVTGLVYSTAKAALIHLTRCLAVELGEHAIRVNSVSPGPVLTGIFGKGAGLDADLADRPAPGLAAAFGEILPGVQALPGMATVGDIAAAVLFLASDSGRFMNGHNLIVDGGTTAGRPAAVMRDERTRFNRALQAAAS